MATSQWLLKEKTKLNNAGSVNLKEKKNIARLKSTISSIKLIIKMKEEVLTNQKETDRAIKAAGDQARKFKRYEKKEKKKTKRS